MRKLFYIFLFLCVVSYSFYCFASGLLTNPAKSINTSDANINGGTIDNTIVGGKIPAAGTFTKVTINGSGTGLANLVSGDVLPTGTGEGLFNFTHIPAWRNDGYSSRMTPMYRVKYSFGDLAIQGKSMTFGNMLESSMWDYDITGTATNATLTVNSVDTDSSITGYLTSKPSLSIGTDANKVATVAFNYRIGGVNYAKAAVAAGTAIAAGTIPNTKYGACALDVAVDGTIDTKVYVNKDSYDIARANIANPDAGHIRIGYVLVKNNTGSDWIFGTDLFSEAGTTVYYYDNACMNTGDGYLTFATAAAWDVERFYVAPYNVSTGAYFHPQFPVYMTFVGRYDNICANKAHSYNYFGIENTADTDQAIVVGSGSVSTTGHCSGISITVSSTEAGVYQLYSPTAPPVYIDDGGWHLIEFYLFGTNFSVKIDGTEICNQSTASTDGAPSATTLGAVLTASTTWGKIQPKVIIDNTVASGMTQASKIHIKSITAYQTGNANP